MNSAPTVDIAAHNRQVSELWEAFSRGENRRVPIAMATDEYLWLGLTGNSFAQFYTDPRVQLAVTLEGEAWFRDTVVHDRPMGPPDVWRVAPRFWMDEPECFGCNVLIQEDDFAWSEPLAGSKADLLAAIRDIDPRQAVLSSRLWRLYGEMKDLCEGLQFRDRPVEVVFPGGGTHGVFTVAGRVRGLEALCLDLAEDPDFAFELIGLIADKTVERIAAWHELARTGEKLPSPGGWGMADDSLQVISATTFEKLVLPHHERVFSAMTTGPRHVHLCGYAQQHFPVLYEKLGVRSLDGPGTFVDHGALLAQMPELTISAQSDHTVQLLGPVGDIEAMMARMLTSAAKQPGRYWITGFLFRETPPAHVEALYNAGVRLGAIGPGE
jgi:hypothetical protein